MRARNTSKATNPLKQWVRFRFFLVTLSTVFAALLVVHQPSLLAEDVVLVSAIDRNNLTEEQPMADVSNSTRVFYNASLRKYRDNVPRWTDRYPFLPAVDDVPDDQRLCKVHVGKTAGSTLSCYLGFRYPKCDDNHHVRREIMPGGKLPQFTTNLIHTHYDTCQHEQIAIYLFTLREHVFACVKCISFFAMIPRCASIDLTHADIILFHSIHKLQSAATDEELVHLRATRQKDLGASNQAEKAPLHGLWLSKHEPNRRRNEQG